MIRAQYGRKTLAILMIFLVVYTTAPYCRAADGSDNETESAEDVKRITGTVAKISFVFSTLMLTSELGYVTFKVPEDATIMRGPNDIGLEEIRAGETITIQYRHPYPSEYIAVYIRASEEYRD